MDDGLGILGAEADAVQVVEIAAPDVGPLRRDGRGGCVGSGQSGDLVTGGEQVVDHGGADPAGRSGDEYAHDVTSLVPPLSGRRQLLTLPAYVSPCHHLHWTL